MKKTMILIATILTLTAFAQEPAKNATPLASNDGKAHIKFETQTIDFGKIKKGITVEKEFAFASTGAIPLIITTTHASCGCTASHAPTEAIKPGRKDAITAKYNAQNMGAFTKTITVSTNAEESNIVLTIRGEVVE
jgi:hypothetical protein